LPVINGCRSGDASAIRLSPDKEKPFAFVCEQVLPPLAQAGLGEADIHFFFPYAAYGKVFVSAIGRSEAKQMDKVGKLDRIIRYPVKAMRGESLPSCRVDNFGLYGDRSRYFLDDSRSGKFLSADRAPQILGYQAELIGEERGDAYPQVRITSPNGTVYTWEDERLRHEIETATQRPVTPKVNTPDQGGENWEDHILIATDASIRKMAKLWGKELDPRRFRANLLIALEQDQPFLEDEWLGKQIRINDVVLQVNKHCERCMYINIDPTDLSIDPTLLKTLVKERDNRFGVYASVIQPGTVRRYDEVFVL
jgi:uncharacterized protein YcbX